MPQTRIPCLMIRGGTSKGAYFLAGDLPDDPASRDRLLLAAMGSPDARQIDGIGGADSLTSKVAIIRASSRPGIDVDYLFAQIVVNEPRVDYGQNCGNILAGVGPFALERKLVPVQAGVTSVRIYMENTGQTATALVQTPDGVVSYDGDAQIDGVPGSSAPVIVRFDDIAGSSCGSLLPTGNALDRFDGVEVTCIDNGMPVVLLRAEDFGLNGKESRDELNNNGELRRRLESIRLQAGPRMNLGDVTHRTVPKMSLISAPASGGSINSRTFIPHTCHASIGVFGAVSVATACLIPGSVARPLARFPSSDLLELSVEHPTGEFTVEMQLSQGSIVGCGLLRTARLLFDGMVCIQSPPRI
ncbi:4-oxalomesaconate tautomerase [Pseudomonas moorei]|uniref:4-oxalomesaconate tautomerase n=1 Tax=Pseudomonas moorei TaxID=395599 RepID=UPI001FF32135|nr:4-oxalomesaconate tautomerase [Pseudomonas moorei]